MMIVMQTNIINEIDTDCISNAIERIISEDMEKCGAITEIEEELFTYKPDEDSDNEYLISVKVSRIMEDEDEE